MINKCIEDAEKVINYFCNIRGIPENLREDYRSQGLLGLSTALDRSKQKQLKCQLNTYTTHFVKGYLRNYYRNQNGERAKDWKAWIRFNKPKNIDDYSNNIQLSSNNNEEKIILKDLIEKIPLILTKRQLEVFNLLYVRNYRPFEVAKELKVTKYTINSHIISIRKKLGEKESKNG